MSTTTIGVRPAHTGLSSAHRRVIVGAALGSVFEWYDFFLYGALAAIIAAQFFAKADPATGLIFALLAFSAGFIVRPAGAVLFGIIGADRDQRGSLRRLVLARALSRLDHPAWPVAADTPIHGGGPGQCDAVARELRALAQCQAGAGSAFGLVAGFSGRDVACPKCVNGASAR